MKKIFLDDTLREQLSACTMPQELCDITGRVIGHYVPVALDSADADAIERLNLPEVLAQFLADTGCQSPLALFADAEEPASV